LKFLKLSPFLLILSVGCVTTDYDRSENFLFSWKIGDLENAALEAEYLGQNGPKRDRLLYQLEEGSIKRIKGDIFGSIKSFAEVAKEYDRWFGVHLKSEKKISEELVSTLGTAEWKPYKSRVYERVMMRCYQALNYLQTGDKGRARAEIFKIRQAVEDSKQIWKRELESAREQMANRGVDIDEGLEKSQKDKFQDELNRLKAKIPNNYPVFVNPAALYLESLYFLHGGSGKDDFEKAEFTLRQLSSIYPDNKWILEDYRLAETYGRDIKPVTYVFFETGRSPVRLEKRFDLPIMFFKSTSRIPYLGLAMPSLGFNEQYIKDLKVSEKGNNSLVQTKMLADFDLIVSQEFEKFYPVELTRAISSAILKGGMQYLATNAVRSEDETLRTAVGVGAGMLSQATTRADLRCWSTLPKQIRFCKLPNPSNNKLTIRGVGTNYKEEINVNPAKTNILIVRSISSHVKLNMVNHITFP
jgi:hypothetical protein